MRALFLLMLVCASEVYAQQAFNSKATLVNVADPCDRKGCYVYLELDKKIIEGDSVGLAQDRLIELVQMSDAAVDVSFTADTGVLVKHLTSGERFELVGIKENHPVQLQLNECFASPYSGSSLYMASCYSEASDQLLGVVDRLESLLRESGVEIDALAQSFDLNLERYKNLLRKKYEHEQGSKYQYFYTERVMNFIEAYRRQLGVLLERN